MYMCTPNARVPYNTHHEHLVLLVLDVMNLPDSESPKQSALDAFFNMSVFPPTPQDIFPNVGEIQQNFRFALQNYRKFIIYARK